MKILYVHGLQSSGASSSAETIRSLRQHWTVISPDIPVTAPEAVDMIRDTVAREEIDVVVGTSMGGMLAQKMRGVPKVLVNPAFHVSESMRRKMGTVPFYSPRADGATEYEITPEMCDGFLALERTQFDSLDEREADITFALFGAHDDTVDCRDEYLQHYHNYEMFEGGHRLDPEAITGHLLPLLDRMEEGFCR